MDRGMAGAALHSASEIDHLARLSVRIDCLAKFRYLFHGLLDCDIPAAHRRRNPLGNALDFGIRHVEGPPDVFNRRARAERTERDDLTHALATGELCHALTHLSSP